MMSGTTSDGEVLPLRIHVVLLDAFSCGCGKPIQYHFTCSHYVATAHHRNFPFESRTPWEFSVERLYVPGVPVLSPFLTSHNGQRTPVRHTLLIQRTVGTNVVIGRGAGSIWSWVSFLAALGEVE
jgi:hypothetical protein